MVLASADTGAGTAPMLGPQQFDEAVERIMEIVSGSAANVTGAFLARIQVRAQLEELVSAAECAAAAHHECQAARREEYRGRIAKLKRCREGVAEGLRRNAEAAMVEAAVANAARPRHTSITESPVRVPHTARSSDGFTLSGAAAVALNSALGTPSHAPSVTSAKSSVSAASRPGDLGHAAESESVTGATPAATLSAATAHNTAVSAGSADANGPRSEHRSRRRTARKRVSAPDCTVTHGMEQRSRANTAAPLAAAATAPGLESSASCKEISEPTLKRQARGKSALSASLARLTEPLVAAFQRPATAGSTAGSAAGMAGAVRAARAEQF